MGKNNGGNIQKSARNNNVNTKGTVRTEGDDVHLTVYTLLSLIAVTVAGITTGLAGALSANPAFYGVDTIYGNGYYSTYIHMVSQALFDGTDEGPIKLLFILSAVVAGLGAVIALADIICAMNPLKKPKTIFSWISLILSIGAMVLYIVGFVKVYKVAVDTDFFERGFKFTIMVGTGIAHVINVIAMAGNVIGNYIGLKRYNKNGKAY